MSGKKTIGSVYRRFERMRRKQVLFRAFLFEQDKDTLYVIDGQ